MSNGNIKKKFDCITNAVGMRFVSMFLFSWPITIDICCCWALQSFRISPTHWTRTNNSKNQYGHKALPKHEHKTIQMHAEFGTNSKRLLLLSFVFVGSQPGTFPFNFCVLLDAFICTTKLIITISEWLPACVCARKTIFESINWSWVRASNGRWKKKSLNLYRTHSSAEMLLLLKHAKRKFNEKPTANPQRHQQQKTKCK